MLPAFVFFIALITSILYTTFTVGAFVALIVEKEGEDDIDYKIRLVFTVIVCLLWTWLYWLSH